MSEKVIRPLEVSREPLITNKLVEVKEEVQSFLERCGDPAAAVGTCRIGCNCHVTGGSKEAVGKPARQGQICRRPLNSVSRAVVSTACTLPTNEVRTWDLLRVILMNK